MTPYQAHLTQLQSRFEQAMVHHQLDAILIYSGHHGYAFLDDNAMPFRVNPYFKIWLPLLKQERSFVLVRPNAKPKLFLYQIADYWHAEPTLPSGEWQDAFELEIIDDPAKALKTCHSKFNNAALIGDTLDQSDMFQDWPEASLNPSGLLAQLDYQRAYKTEYELENLRAANRLAAKAHKVAKHAFFNGASELEIHHAYLASLACREIDLPYNNIIALNEHAAVLHYDDYAPTPPAQSKSFLIDAGSSVNGYHADISRTYVGPDVKDGAEFAALFQAYKREYFALLDEIQIGHSYLDFHDSAHRRLSGLLSEFELVNCSAEQAYALGYSRTFFPCGVGHYIGAQVHDVGGHLANELGELLPQDPRYPFLRLLRPMERNTVFTVEPGIYFIPQLLAEQSQNPDFNWSRIHQLKAFGGFRLEDSMAITELGVENLSAPHLDH